MTEETPSLLLGPELGMPVADPDVGISTSSSDAAEEIPRAEIPSSGAPTGKSSFDTFQTGHDMSSRATEKGESSSGSSLRSVKRMLARALSTWIETLLSGHLEVGFSMIPNVQLTLNDAEEAGVDVTEAKVIVDGIIALGDKWSNTVNLSDDRFFTEMFQNPADRAQSDLNEATQSRKRLVREKNREELALIGLGHDVDILEGEIEETKKRLEHLQAQVSAKWVAINEARHREGDLIRQVKEANRVLEGKTEENKRWEAARKELPGVGEAVHGRFLKKRAFETMTAEAQSLLKELKLWLETVFD